VTRSLAGLALAALCAGCVTYQRGTIDAAAPQPPPLDMVTVAEQVEGRSCGKWQERQYELAVDDALAKAPGAEAMTDVRYRFDNLCIVVDGRAVRIDRADD
jgi:hypothetical protein